MDFVTLLRQGAICFDGGFGTQVSALSKEVSCPEMLNLTHPEAVQAVHRAYAQAGAQVVETNSLGGNALKLATHGLADRVEELAATAVTHARAAVGEDVLVAYSVGTTGQFLYPVGMLPLTEAIAAYRRPMEAAARAGADLFIIETMTDIGDMRAAILAAQPLGLPILASYTFEANGRLMTGGTAACAALSAGALGVTALGINCSTGPADMLPLLAAMRQGSALPVIVQPNAGLPQINPQGETFFSQSIEDMVPQMAALLDQGAAGIGGCCGTTPDYIRAFSALTAGRPAPEAPVVDATLICSSREHLPLGEALSDLAEVTLLDKDVSDLYDLEEGSAVLLHLDALTPQAAAEAVSMAQLATSRPLLFQAKDAQVLEAALRAYHGRSAVSGADGSEDLLARYGALHLS